MLVLDISGSMAEDEDDKKISMLVKAVNSTIQEILDMNEKNRVGVVLYSGALNYDCLLYTSSGRIYYRELE